MQLRSVITNTQRILKTKSHSFWDQERKQAHKRKIKFAKKILNLLYVIDCRLNFIYIHNFIIYRWKYQSSSELKGAPNTGQIGVTYSGAGSIQDLSSLKDESAEIIKYGSKTDNL